MKIKPLIRSLLPAVLINQISLQYRKLRIATIDKFLFPEQDCGQESFIILFDEYPFNGTVIEVEHLVQRQQQQVKFW